VSVRQQGNIDSPVLWRHVLAEKLGNGLRVRTAVNEDLLAAGCNDKYAVAVSNSDEVNVQSWVRLV